MTARVEPAEPTAASGRPISLTDANGASLRAAHGGAEADKKHLRIGIDGGCWLNQRGYGRYTRCLLKALAERHADCTFYFFADPQTAEALDLPANFHTVRVGTREAAALAASAGGRRSIRDLLRMGWAVRGAPIDVFFFPSAYTYFPILRSLPMLVTIHDVIAERHPGQVFAAPRFRKFWNMKMKLAVRQATRILTVSDHARDGILEQFRVQSDRVDVILEAPDPVFQPLSEPKTPSEVLPNRGLEGDFPYLLYVGGLSPHKNLPALVEAFARITSGGKNPDLRLLLVGDYEKDVFLSAYEGLRSLVDAKQLGNRVCFTGFVPDEALVHLYNRATLLVMPSLEEGYGLPAAEAASCGTPVVISEVGPMGAILAGGAWTIRPENVDELATALATLLEDEPRRQAMGAEALRRIRDASWERAADQLYEILLRTARK